MAQRVRIARSGRKHHVSKHRAVAAMHHCQDPQPLPSGGVWFEGRDSRGRLTEVGVFTADEDDQLLIVFHALPKEW